MSILWDNGRGMTTHEIIDLFQGGDDPFLLFDGIAAPLRRSGKGGEQEKEGQYAGGLHHGHSFSALPCSMRRVIWSAS